MKTPTKAEVSRLAQRYHDAMSEWGEANLETGRREAAYREAKEQYDAAKKRRLDRKLQRALEDEMLK